MRLLTLDASVILKWYLRTPDEHDLSQAAAILVGLRSGSLALAQPPHTLLEVAAVLVRERPQSVTSDLAEIAAVLDDATLSASRVLPRALQIAATLEHHLFDTLYPVSYTHLLDAFPSPDELWQRYCAWKGIASPERRGTVETPYYDDGSGKSPRYYQVCLLYTSRCV